MRSRLGYQPSMLSLASIMVHPGKRFGSMIESASFCALGLLVGAAWAIFGRFLAQRIIGDDNLNLDEEQLNSAHFDIFQKCLVLLSMFEIIMLFFHGFIRVIDPHFFGIMFPLFLVVHFALLDDLSKPALAVFQAYLVPFFLGIAISIVCNLFIFPEFGSTYLGTTTLSALNQLHATFDSSIQYFVMSPFKDNLSGTYTSGPVQLKQLLSNQKLLKQKLSQCQSVLKECTYEISYSYLSPSELKFFLKTFAEMNKYLLAIINGCQLEFAVLDDGHESIDEAGNKQLLQMLEKIKTPIIKLHRSLSESIYYLKLGICYTYDVNPKDCNESCFLLEGVPVNIETMNFKEQNAKLSRAITEFDETWRVAIESFANSDENGLLLLPQDDIFLLSWFILNFKEFSTETLKLNLNLESLVATKKSRMQAGWLFGKKIWISFLTNREMFVNWLNKSTTAQMSESQSLQSGRAGNSTQFSLSSYARPRTGRSRSLSLVENREINLFKASLQPSDDEKKIRSWNLDYQLSLIVLFMLKLGTKYRPHITFGLQCVMALMLASFPMFIPEIRHWYVDIRGAWIGFVCILVVEPSVGDTFWVFFLRGAGIILGASWGYLSYVAGCHQRYVVVEVTITIIGAIPGFYFFLGTPYVKGAIIGLVSLYVVILATVIPSAIGGSILINWGKRCLAFIYGGFIGLVSNLCVFPVQAKRELMNELSYICHCCAEMQMVYASGLDGEKSVISISKPDYDRFIELSEDCKRGLLKAEAYNKAAKTEPSFKGDFKKKSKLFEEMIFILNEISSRMENIVLLRLKYGSEVIEELNSIAYPYRRQTVASVNNILLAIREALINKTPLPQYLPSARNSQRKLIKIIRAHLSEKYDVTLEDKSSSGQIEYINDVDSDTVLSNILHRKQGNKYLLKDKLLSWCATTAGLEEIINYVEELVELSKILVGVNEFKYSFLSRSIEYEQKIIETKIVEKKDGHAHENVYSSPSDVEIETSSLSSESSVSLNNFDPVEYFASENSGPRNLLPTYESILETDSLRRVESIDSYRHPTRNLITRVYSLKTALTDVKKQADAAMHNENDLPVALKRIFRKKFLNKKKKW
ncbi:hypothetical protein DASC09_053840 [Saccharomycopsis crataegensis]|uniref:ER transporter 6TM N-terminal domain-containing protein n=1 Tax=Saccharomycopsis crataegensis TaxID=43959 RepID=A0AAV5QTH8_9ASCO|nr:hypothetical protein DASC09_053840 [Saccharomycopsis crataegensis]